MTPSRRQRLVEQRLLRRQDRLQADPRLGAEARPTRRAAAVAIAAAVSTNASAWARTLRLVVAAGDGRPVGAGGRVDAGGVGPEEVVLERRPLVQPRARRRPGRCPSAPAGRSTTGGSSGASVATRCHPIAFMLIDGLGERRLDVLADARCARRRRARRSSPSSPAARRRGWPTARRGRSALPGSRAGRRPAGTSKPGVGEVGAHDVVHPRAVPARAGPPAARCAPSPATRRPADRRRRCPGRRPVIEA